MPAKVISTTLEYINSKKIENGGMYDSIEPIVKPPQPTETNNNQKHFTNGFSKEQTVGNGNILNSEVKDKVLKDPRKRFLWMEFETPLIWLNIISIGGFHLLALWGYYAFPYVSRFPISLYTVLWAVVTGGLAGFGVTGGAHRLWAHRAYKAKLPLRIILVCCYAMAGQNRLYDWVRDHRVHHKFSETDADPHNAKRGFFFAHVGWLMMRKHRDVIQRGRQVDMSDILEDPVVQFFEKYFLTMKMLFCFILPSIVPVYFWNETWYFGIFSQCIVRYVMSLNFTWLVNSAAHIWGNKPYDRRISPAENLGVAIVAMGEGWHNYHHVFPWDYKAAELGNYKANITTFWLDQFAKIGWAYDRKEPSQELIRKVIANNGDGTHGIYGHKEIPVEENKKTF